MQHEYDTPPRRTRSVSAPFVRNPARGDSCRAGAPRHRAAGRPVASNPRCAYPAQSRGLFGSECTLPLGPLGGQRCMHCPGGRIDPRRRRVRRPSSERQIRKRQRGPGARRFGHAGADLRYCSIALSPGSKAHALGPPERSPTLAGLASPVARRRRPKLPVRSSHCRKVRDGSSGGVSKLLRNGLISMPPRRRKRA